VEDGLVEDHIIEEDEDIPDLEYYNIIINYKL